MMHVQIRISGKVQGVAFRYYTKLKADELGLMGTTENQSDGSVITWAYGEEEKVKKLISWCQIGSPASKVEQVKIIELDAMENDEYEDFSILR